MHAELAKIGRETDRIVQAICDGVPGHKVKDRMTELEARKDEIEAKLRNADVPLPLMHPNMRAIIASRSASCAMPWTIPTTAQRLPISCAR